MTGNFHRSSLVARDGIEGRIRQLLRAAEMDAKPAILDEIDVLLHAAHVDPTVETRTGAMPLSQAYRTFQGSSATIFKEVFEIPSYCRCRATAEALVRDLSGPGTAAGIASDVDAERCGDNGGLRIIQRFLDPGRRFVRLASRMAA